VRRLYRQLGLEYDLATHQRLSRYVEGVAEYRKNRLPPLTPVERRNINAALGPYFERWGYGTPTAEGDADAA
jgi:hypothetical protein